MLTIFTIPKAFIGHIGLIQRNAAASWMRLPNCEVFLCGDDEGVGQAAAHVGARWIPNVERNEFGTPLLDGLFREVSQDAAHPLICYVNADIILTSDDFASLQKIRFQDFLLVGRRCDLDVVQPIDFSDPGWSAELLAAADEHGTMSPPDAIDYFVMPRGSRLTELPRFAVGRPGWDNWMIQRARTLGLPVIDATALVHAIHQNHDYAHVKSATGPKWEGPEGESNRSHLASDEYLFSISDATHELTSDGAIALPYSRERVLRRLHAFEALHPKAGKLARGAIRLVMPVWRVVRRTGRALRGPDGR